MKLQEACSQPLTSREKVQVAIITALFALLGGGLGVIAYHQQWLG